MNGLGYKDGKVIVVHNGYISDTKEALETYKKEHSNFWKEKLGVSDFDLAESTTYDYEEED